MVFMHSSEAYPHQLFTFLSGPLTLTAHIFLSQPVSLINLFSLFVLNQLRDWVAVKSVAYPARARSFSETVCTIATASGVTAHTAIIPCPGASMPTTTTTQSAASINHCPILAQGSCSSLFPKSIEFFKQSVLFWASILLLQTLETCTESRHRLSSDGTVQSFPVQVVQRSHRKYAHQSYYSAPADVKTGLITLS